MSLGSCVKFIFGTKTLWFSRGKEREEQIAYVVEVKSTSVKLVVVVVVRVAVAVTVLDQ